jgi:hypothetical protein
MIAQADTAAVLRKAAQGLRDPERVVLDPWHLFEDANGDEAMEGEVPCRACAVGHIMWASTGEEARSAALDAVDPLDAVIELTRRLEDEGAAAVADLYERVADGLERPLGVKVTQAAEESS